MVEVCRALVLEENQVESAEARGVGEHVDLDDLATLDPEAEDDAAVRPGSTRLRRFRRRAPVAQTGRAPRRCRPRPVRLALPPARPFVRPRRRLEHDVRVEQHDEWVEGCRYLGLDVLALAQALGTTTEEITAEQTLPAIAA